MTTLIDVRVRVPKNRLGDLVDGVLPDWAQVVGFDTLRPTSKNGSGRPLGTGHGGITEELAQEIRKQARKGTIQREIAEELNISTSTVSRVLNKHRRRS